MRVVSSLPLCPLARTCALVTLSPDCFLALLSHYGNSCASFLTKVPSYCSLRYRTVTLTTISLTAPRVRGPLAMARATSSLSP